MHIAMVSWLSGKPVPPTGYGGIERVVHTLSVELIRQGHTVTLVVPPGSFVEGARHLYTTNFDKAFQFLQGLDADIIHSHECWALDSVVRRNPDLPFVATTHVMHSVGWTKNVVYLSVAQCIAHKEQNGLKHEGVAPIIRVPTSPLLKPKGLPREDFLLFLGSVSPNKGVHRAAKLAGELERKLVVAGPASGEYADRVARMPYVDMVGEVQDPYRSKLIEQAYAMMCLHGDEGGWSEPGCGVVGEAGAFNTPVAALPNGCLDEIVMNGDNGWIAPTVLGVKRLMLSNPTLQDAGLRARTAWSAETITHQYVDLYKQVIAGRRWE